MKRVIVGAAATALAATVLPAAVAASPASSQLARPVLAWSSVTRDGVSTLVLANQVGGRQRRFATRVHVLGSPSVSANSASIAVSMNLGENLGRYGIGLLDSAGHLDTLTRPTYADVDPAFSPTGDYIVAVRQTVGFPHHGACCELVRIPVDGQGARVIPGVRGNLADPAVSPDGERIAFVSGGLMKTVSSAGGRPIVAYRGTALSAPEWSPDGKSIVVADQTGRDASRLMLVSTAGHPAHRIARVAGVLDHPQWDLGGKGLLALNYHGVGDGGRTRQQLIHVTIGGQVRPVRRLGNLVHGLGRGVPTSPTSPAQPTPLPTVTPSPIDTSFPGDSPIPVPTDPAPTDPEATP